MAPPFSFQEKPECFLDAVVISLESLIALNVHQHRDLAIFKAAELIKALV